MTEQKKTEQPDPTKATELQEEQLDTAAGGARANPDEGGEVARGRR